MKINISELRTAYKSGENITQLLIEQQPGLDRAEIIEIAYDIQSGSYTQSAIDNPDRLRDHAKGIFNMCKEFINKKDTILDCGAGELTTLSTLSNHLPEDSKLLACDISLSRLRVGRRYSYQTMHKDLAKSLNLFVADMATLPLANSSIDVVFTSHALEPNHGREKELLSELIRVARRNLILLSPPGKCK